jgi:hypothetical protein
MAGGGGTGFGSVAASAGPVPAAAPGGVGGTGGVAFSGVLIKGSRCRAEAWRDKGKIEPEA